MVFCTRLRTVPGPAPTPRAAPRDSLFLRRLVLRFTVFALRGTVFRGSCCLEGHGPLGPLRAARPGGGLAAPGLAAARLATPGPKRPNQQVEERGGPGEEKTGPANRPARARLRHIDRPAHSQPGPGRRVCRARFARGGPGARTVSRSCSTMSNNVRHRRTQVENGRSSSPRAIEKTFHVSISCRISAHRRL